MASPTGAGSRPACTQNLRVALPLKRKRSKSPSLAVTPPASQLAARIALLCAHKVEDEKLKQVAQQILNSLAQPADDGGEQEGLAATTPAHWLTATLINNPARDNAALYTFPAEKKRRLLLYPCELRELPAKHTSLVPECRTLYHSVVVIRGQGGESLPQLSQKVSRLGGLLLSGETRSDVEKKRAANIALLREWGSSYLRPPPETGLLLAGKPQPDQEAYRVPQKPLEISELFAGDLHDLYQGNVPYLSADETAHLKTFPQLHSLLLQATHGLAFMHSKGYAHGDLKPENWFLRANGSVVLADIESMSKSGEKSHIAGTSGYSSFERLLSRDTECLVTIGDDLFALGTILFQFLFVDKSWYSNNRALWAAFPFAGTDGSQAEMKIKYMIGDANPTREMRVREYALLEQRLEWTISVSTPEKALYLEEIKQTVLDLLAYNPKKRPSPESVIDTMTIAYQKANKKMPESSVSANEPEDEE